MCMLAKCTYAYAFHIRMRFILRQCEYNTVSILFFSSLLLLLFLLIVFLSALLDVWTVAVDEQCESLLMIKCVASCMVLFYTFLSALM